MLFLKEEIDDRYQYWALSFFFAYGPITLFLNLDKGQNLSFLIQVLLLCFTYDRCALFRSVFKYKLNVIWLLLALYHWFNHGIQGVPHEYNYIDVFIPLFQCYFLLVWTCYLALKDTSRTIKFMLIGYMSYISLAALNAMIMSGYSFSSIGEEERLSGGIHLTQMGAAAGLTVFIIALLYHHSKYPILKVLPFLIVPLVIVIMAASRNGLIITIVGLSCLFIADLFTPQKSSKKLFTLLLLAIPVTLVVFYLLQETYVGERLLGTKEQSESLSDSIDYQTGTFLDYLGDRTWYYVLGFSNFLDHPIFGIGFYNFKHYNDAPFIMHPEYMLEIAEGGLMACVLFFTFILSLLYYMTKLFVCYRNEMSFILLLFVLITIMTCFSTTICHDIQYWPLIGLCIASIMKVEKRIHYVSVKSLLITLLMLYIRKKRGACL